MSSLGTERSVQLFAPADWTSREPTGPTGVDYPGLRPIGSWQLYPGGELRGVDATASGWRDRATGNGIDVSGRDLVVAYGSNADPAKLLAKAGFLGGRSVIALRAAILGWAAAWCDARRHGDQSVVATLVPVPGRMEVHPVLALTPHQLHAMDGWEGDPDYYHRVAHQGSVLLESGQSADGVQVYLGTPQRRPALMAEGRPLLVAEVPYRQVDRLVRQAR